MSPYEKHKNYKFKALRVKIEKSGTVKGAIILTYLSDLWNKKVSMLHHVLENVKFLRHFEF